MKFGKYAILDNSKHFFDQEPDWYWEFRPVNSEDELRMAKWVDANAVTVEYEGKTLKAPPDWIQTAWQELMISFGGTNIPGDPGVPVSEGGAPILTPESSEDEILAELKDMPVEMLTELWTALGEAYPFWGPRISPKEEDSENESPDESEPEQPSSQS
jgi:hypothetical protein